MSQPTTGTGTPRGGAPQALLDALERALGAIRVLIVPKGSALPSATKGRWRRGRTHLLSVDIPGLEPPRQIVWELPEEPTAAERSVATTLARSLTPKAKVERRRAPRVDTRGLLAAIAKPPAERPEAMLEVVSELLRAKAGGLALAGAEPKTFTVGSGRPILRRAAVEALSSDGRFELHERSFVMRRVMHGGRLVAGIALEEIGASAELDACVELIGIALSGDGASARTESPETPDRSAILTAALSSVPLPALAVDADGELVAASPEGQRLFELTDFDIGTSVVGRLGSLSIQRLEEGSGVPRELDVGGRRVEPVTTGLPGGGWFFLFRDLSAEEQAAEAREDLMAAMAHELRTPVAVVKALLGVLMHPKMRSDAEKLEGLVSDGVKEIARLERLVEDLLLCARVATGGIVPHLENIEIRPIVDDVRKRVEKRYTEVRFDIRGTAPARADATLVRHAIWHLVDNACKFGPSDGVVTIEIASADSSTTVEVTDKGEGVFSGDLEEVFEPFHRADRGETQHRGGAGVGLYLVKAIVDAQEGEVWVRSRLGKGSTFGFRLPRPHGE